MWMTMLEEAVAECAPIAAARGSEERKEELAVFAGGEVSDLEGGSLHACLRVADGAECSEGRHGVRYFDAGALPPSCGNLGNLVVEYLVRAFLLEYGTAGEARITRPVKVVESLYLTYWPACGASTSTRARAMEDMLDLMDAVARWIRGGRVRPSRS